MEKKEFLQPILSFNPEPNHDRENVLTLEEFLKLLRIEEDYFEGDEHNTKLMITRLRKIFYDQWGWNSQLITKAKHVEMRFVVKIVEESSANTHKVDRYSGVKYEPKHRLLTYRDDDRVFGNSKKGQTPKIVKHDHQEVILPQGYYCDIAHVLAGLDASNHPQVVSPLPKFLKFIEHLFPHTDSNKDIVTWLGDIASSCGNFLFNYLEAGKKPNSKRREQYEVNKGAPGSDMLGNIDAFVISQHYDISTNNGTRLTDILKSYYFDEASPRLKRFTTFSNAIGLQNWDGNKFANERIWLKYYGRQLRNNTCFQVFSLTDQKLHSVILPTKIWFGWYRKVLKMDKSLEVLLKVLKKQIKLEA